MAAGLAQQHHVGHALAAREAATTAACAASSNRSSKAEMVQQMKQLQGHFLRMMIALQA
jgi:hypothetical protein